MTARQPTNLSGMVAQRWALIAHLGAFDGDAWTRPLADGSTPLEALASVVRLYGMVLGQPDVDDVDAGNLVDEFDRRADLVEAKVAERGDAGSDVEVEVEVDHFEPVGATATVAVHCLMAELVRLALKVGAPVPPPARDAAAAAVAWQVSDSVEMPARVVLDGVESGPRELLLGGGDPKVTVRANPLAFVCAAFGVERGHQLDVEGPPDAVDAFRRSFIGAWRA